MFALKFNDILISSTTYLIWGIIGLVSSVYYIYTHVKWMKSEIGVIYIKDVVTLGVFLIVGTLSGLILPLFLYMDYLFDKRIQDRPIYTKER